MAALRLRNNPDRIFHLPSDVAELILAVLPDKIEKVPTIGPRPKLVQQLEWHAGYLERSGRRAIEYHCLGCQQKGVITDFSGDCKKPLVFCCGSGATVPKWVAEKYAKLSATEPAPKKTDAELFPKRTW